jgi:hypothetical protein
MVDRDCSNLSIARQCDLFLINKEQKSFWQLKYERAQRRRYETTIRSAVLLMIDDDSGTVVGRG